MLIFSFSFLFFVLLWLLLYNIYSISRQIDGPNDKIELSEVKMRTQWLSFVFFFSTLLTHIYTYPISIKITWKPCTIHVVYISMCLWKDILKWWIYEWNGMSKWVSDSSNQKTKKKPYWNYIIIMQNTFHSKAFFLYERRHVYILFGMWVYASMTCVWVLEILCMCVVFTYMYSSLSIWLRSSHFLAVVTIRFTFSVRTHSERKRTNELTLFSLSFLIPFIAFSRSHFSFIAIYSFHFHYSHKTHTVWIGACIYSIKNKMKVRMMKWHPEA